jgi:uroporphyrin-III C-methyltransferase
MDVKGKVYLVGAGPGDPELLAVKAHRLLREADVVLHDDLVPAAILALAKAQATIENVGKRCGAKKITQAEINDKMIAAARSGLAVVRLKSGDPGIFGRLAEEIDALKEAQVAYEIVPGITAGIGAAAAIGVSLTDRRKAARVVIVSGHKAHKGEPEEKIDWKTLARKDATLILYMPGHEFKALQEELLSAGLPSDTPAAIISRATTPEQQQEFTTIGNLGMARALAAPSLLLIGWALEGAEGKRRNESLAGAVAEYAELMLASE